MSISDPVGRSSDNEAKHKRSNGDESVDDSESDEEAISTVRPSRQIIYSSSDESSESESEKAESDGETFEQLSTSDVCHYLQIIE